MRWWADPHTIFVGASAASKSIPWRNMTSLFPVKPATVTGLRVWPDVECRKARPSHGDGGRAGQGPGQPEQRPSKPAATTCRTRCLSSPQQRGKALEALFNELCRIEGILVREAFTMSSEAAGGVEEQVDGVISLEGEIYLVEMKYLAAPVGADHLGRFVSRVFLHTDARGLLLSASGFTEPAVEQCRFALTQKTVILCDLKEILVVLEGDQTLPDYLQRKVRAAIIDRRPLTRPFG